MHIDAYLQLPAISSARVIAEPREKVADGDTLVRITLTLQNETSLCPVLGLEIFRCPLYLEFSKKTGHNKRVTFPPYTTENLVRKLRICEIAGGVARCVGDK